MSTEPSSRPVFSQQLILSPLFTRVRGRAILRSSSNGDSRKFAVASYPSSARVRASGRGEAFINGHLADALQTCACYATSVTLRGGGLTSFFLRPTENRR